MSPAEEQIVKQAHEIARLRKGIQDYLNGDYGPRPERRSKLDKCPHGMFVYEACENCIDAHFSRLLEEGYTVSNGDSQ